MTPFFDSNIVVYAFLDIAKRERALDLSVIGGLTIVNPFLESAP